MVRPFGHICTGTYPHLHRDLPRCSAAMRCEAVGRTGGAASTSASGFAVTSPRDAIRVPTESICSRDGLTQPTSALGLAASLRRLQQGWTQHPCPICTGIGPTPHLSHRNPGWAHPTLPHRSRDWAGSSEKRARGERRPRRPRRRRQRRRKEAEAAVGGGGGGEEGTQGLLVLLDAVEQEDRVAHRHAATRNTYLLSKFPRSGKGSEPSALGRDTRAR